MTEIIFCEYSHCSQLCIVEPNLLFYYLMFEVVYYKRSLVIGVFHVKISKVAKHEKCKFSKLLMFEVDVAQLDWWAYSSSWSYQDINYVSLNFRKSLVINFFPILRMRSAITRRAQYYIFVREPTSIQSLTEILWYLAESSFCIREIRRSDQYDFRHWISDKSIFLLSFVFM